jgi:hypothetical protein
MIKALSLFSTVLLKILKTTCNLHSAPRQNAFESQTHLPIEGLLFNINKNIANYLYSIYFPKNLTKGKVRSEMRCHLISGYKWETDDEIEI